MTVRSQESGAWSQELGVGAYSHMPSQSSRITRRGFLGFFLLGGVISLLGKKIEAVVGIDDRPKEAMFWRKTDA